MPEGVARTSALEVRGLSSAISVLTPERHVEPGEFRF